MKRSHGETSSPRTAAELKAEIKRLEQIEDALEEALGDFDHELRRVSDALIRAGGRSLELDEKTAQLRKNIRFSQRDLQSNRTQRLALGARLDDVKKRS